MSLRGSAEVDGNLVRHDGFGMAQDIQNNIALGFQLGLGMAWRLRLGVYRVEEPEKRP